ncbi:MAG TPA: monofunctional biosynthetic peptidoglycan transglycosylase [bacterium]
MHSVFWKRILVVIAISGSFYYIFRPSMIFLKFYNPEKTSLMKYRIAEAERKRTKSRIRREWVDYNNISPSLIKAVILAEDEKFWEHPGFDWEGIKYALEVDYKKQGFVRGGSTITQQLAKNLYLKPKRSILRKLHEALLALELELFLSKERILELYLNVIEWGDGIFGIEAASKDYFGKSASELTDEESIRLAAVLPNPRRYSPLRGSRFLDNRVDLLSERFYKISKTIK